MDGSLFRVGGYVSVWLGDIATEGELERYLRTDFSDDFGFTFDFAWGPEAWKTGLST